MKTVKSLRNKKKYCSRLYKKERKKYYDNFQHEEDY